MPESATVEDVEKIYFEGWRLGLKALAIYRNNCKVGQPLSNAREKKAAAESEAADEHRPTRRRLPKQRPSLTTSFTVGGAEGYLTAGSYPDDGLGEIFLKLGKQGSTLAGVMDAFSVAVSIALQYGVPLETYVRKFTNMRFEPAGMTDDPDIRIAQSVIDYIFRRLALDYLPTDRRIELGILTSAERTAQVNNYDTPDTSDDDETNVSDVQVSAPIRSDVADTQSTNFLDIDSSTELIELRRGKFADAPLCFTCGTKMCPAGSCYVCNSCGSTSGCS
jgi:ribonucleoside-diphosphate reductase alpha chain